MPENFLSISGVVSREELRGIRTIKEEENFTYPLAIGYQVSSRSVNSGTHSSRQPSFAELGELCRETRDSGIIPVVHYYTKRPETVVDDLERVVETLGDSTKLVQFNTLPLDLETLRRVRGFGYGIIFKVAVSEKARSGGYSVWKGSNVEDVSTGRVEPLMQQVLERKGLIDYAMFDPSHGINLGLDLRDESLAIAFGREIVRSGELNRVGLIFAGGIGPKNVTKITRKLLMYFPNRVSLDSESAIRTNDQLDLQLVKEFLTEYRWAREYLENYRSSV